MDNNLSQRAVNLALNGRWEEALELNKEILKKNPGNIDALNRMARAYAELGNIPNARKAANKVLKIDSYNAIAKKSIEKWKRLKSTEPTRTSPVDPKTFLEEPGKTKIVSLVNLGDKNVLAQIDSGDEVQFNTHGHRISICTADGKTVGKLPDDISARIKQLCEYGNEYRIHIKSAGQDAVKVFIRETVRSEKLSDFPSFSGDKVDYIAFTPPELVHKKEDLDMGEVDTEEE
jgi:tetratricopeptide (TPR) repeat protein